MKIGAAAAAADKVIMMSSSEVTSIILRTASVCTEMEGIVREGCVTRRN